MIGAKPLTTDEIRTIRIALKNPRDSALFILNLYSGFRIQESLSLKVSDVMDMGGNMREYVKVFRRNMKGKMSSRTVPMHRVIKEVLYDMIEHYDLEPGDYLFPSNKGGPISRVQAWRILKAVVRSANLDDRISLHSTRKTFAKKVYAAVKGDIVKTAQALGHRSILSTASYLSFNRDEVDSAILDQE